jgi:hypothetical protein
LPYDKIKFEDSLYGYTDAYFGTPSLLDPKKFMNLTRYDDVGKIAQAHALEIRVSTSFFSFGKLSIENYIVTIDTVDQPMKVGPDRIEMLENGRQVKEQGKLAVESYKKWRKIIKVCVTHTRCDGRDIIVHPQPMFERAGGIFEEHAQPIKGNFVHPRVGLTIIGMNYASVHRP